MPLLALLGELDMVPTSHAALLYEQSSGLPATKSVAIVDGMDHSQFCAGFNVSGDLWPEISNADALSTSGMLAGAWLDVVLFKSTAAANTLSQWESSHTQKLTA